MSDKLASLVGKDTYLHPVDKNYLHKGDRFRAQRSPDGVQVEVVYGTAAMDGLFHIQGAVLEDQSYINVLLDHRPLWYYEERRPNYPIPRVNESLYNRDGWSFYSTEAVLNRENEAKNREAMRQELLDAEKGLVADQMRLTLLRKEISELETLIEAEGRLVAKLRAEAGNKGQGWTPSRLK